MIGDKLQLGIPLILCEELEPGAARLLPGGIFGPPIWLLDDMLFEFLTTTEDISGKSWAWFKARYYGYGRPYVSIA